MKVSNDIVLARAVTMAGQFVSPPELAKVSPKGTTTAQRVDMWRDLLAACEQFLLAGLRRKVGPQGDVEAAYRGWHIRQIDQRDCELVQMMERFDRCRRGHAP